MEGTFYLIVRPKNRIYLGGRLIKTVTALKKDERAIKLEVSLPEALFKTPQLEAKIVVDEKKVSPVVINAEVLENIQGVILEQMGVDLKITIVGENG